MTLLVLASLLAQAAPEIPTVREQRRVGLALAPALAFHDVGGQFGADGFIMPLAVAVDGVFARRWAAALSVARFPASHGAITHLHAAARRYLLDDLFSPYLWADLGLEFEGVESGTNRTSPFATAGAGVELASRGGLLLAADAAIGPHRTEGEWQLLARTRILIGFRL